MSSPLSKRSTPPSYQPWSTSPRPPEESSPRCKQISTTGSQGPHCHQHSGSCSSCSPESSLQTLGTEFSQTATLRPGFLPAAGLAQHNRAALNEMQAKHPAPAQPSTFQQESDTPQMHFSQAQVVKAIQSFPKGSDPGPSGLRAEHLKATIKCHAPNRTG